jgi:hypothetical protein
MIDERKKRKRRNLYIYVQATHTHTHKKERALGVFVHTRFFFYLSNSPRENFSVAQRLLMAVRSFPYVWPVSQLASKVSKTLLNY